MKIPPTHILSSMHYYYYASVYSQRRTRSSTGKCLVCRSYTILSCNIIILSSAFVGTDEMSDYCASGITWTSYVIIIPFHRHLDASAV